MKHIRTAILAIALALPSTALAETNIGDDPAAIASAARYAMPHLVSGVRETCSPVLSPDGYLMRNGDALVAKFSQGSDAAWPAAKSFLIETMAKDEDDESARYISLLPDESLKPFVDGILVALVTKEIKQEQCHDVERGLELLDPLPAENVSGLIGFMVEMVEKYDKKEEGDSEAAGDVAGD